MSINHYADDLEAAAARGAGAKAKANVRQDDFLALEMAATKQATVTEGREAVMVIRYRSSRSSLNGVPSA
jgi:hypothetical protein